MKILILLLCLFGFEAISAPDQLPIVRNKLTTNSNPENVPLTWTARQQFDAPLVYIGSGVNLSLGTNLISSNVRSSLHFLSPSSDPSQVILQLTGGTNSGQILYLVNLDTNKGFTLPNLSTNTAGGLVYLNGDWIPTNTFESLQLLFSETNWIEVGRSSPGTNFQDLIWQKVAGVVRTIGISVPVFIQGTFSVGETSPTLVLGTNIVSTTSRSSLRLTSPTNDPTQVFVQLTPPTAPGEELLFLQNYSTNTSAWTLKNRQILSDGLGTTILNGDFIGSQSGQGIFLKWNALGFGSWEEVQRFSPNTNGTVGDLIWENDGVTIHPNGIGVNTNAFKIYPSGSMLTGIGSESYFASVPPGLALLSVRSTGLGEQNFNEILLGVENSTDVTVTNQAVFDSYGDIDTWTTYQEVDTNGIIASALQFVTDVSGSYISIINGATVILKTPVTNAVAGQVFTSDGAGNGYWGTGGTAINPTDNFLPVRSGPSTFANSPWHAPAGVTNQIMLGSGSFVMTPDSLSQYYMDFFGVDPVGYSLIQFQNTNSPAGGYTSVGRSPIGGYFTTTGSQLNFAVFGSGLTFSSSLFGPTLSNVVDLASMGVPFHDLYLGGLFVQGRTGLGLITNSVTTTNSQIEMYDSASDKIVTRVDPANGTRFQMFNASQPFVELWPLAPSGYTAYNFQTENTISTGSPFIVGNNGTNVFGSPLTNAVAGQVLTSAGTGTDYYWGTPSSGLPPGSFTNSTTAGTIMVSGSSTQSTNSPLTVQGATSLKSTAHLDMNGNSVTNASFTSSSSGTYTGNGVGLTNMPQSPVMFAGYCAAMTVNTTGKSFPLCTGPTTYAFGTVNEDTVATPIKRGGTFTNLSFHVVASANGLAVGTGTNYTFILYTNGVASSFLATLTTDGSAKATNTGTLSITVPASSTASWRCTNSVTANAAEIPWSCEFY